MNGVLYSEYFSHCIWTRERERGEHIRVNARSRTANLCGVSKDTVGRLVTLWTKVTRKENHHDDELRDIPSMSLGGNTESKPTRIPRDEEVFCKVRDFIQMKRIAEMRVCVTEVLEFL